jgi:glycosyltransferase involved in cell wall biosynthesis
MDGDLQNDPADIGRLLAELERGPDVVSGWRKDRKDRELGRKLPSRIANALISAVSGVHLHDYGCSLKAYRREVLEGVRLYGEMHRFIPKVDRKAERLIPPRRNHHRPRRAGRSKYGLGRTLKVLLDLLVVKFLATYLARPIYFFGGAGLASLGCGFLAFVAALAYKLAGWKDFVATPLPLLAVALVLAGLLCILMGVLAELVVRTYYESQGRRPYLVAEELAGGAGEGGGREAR